MDRQGQHLSVMLPRQDERSTIRMEERIRMFYIWPRRAETLKAIRLGGWNPFSIAKLVVFIPLDFPPTGHLVNKDMRENPES